MMRTFSGVFIVVFACFSFCSALHAEPRFAAHNGQPCSFCHINPTGGGPRNDNGKVYASQYFNILPDVDHRSANFDDAEPMKNWDLQIDAKFLALKTERGTPTFFPMQTSLYGILQLQPGQKGNTSFIVNLNKSGRDSTFGVEEAYGLYSRNNGFYIKAGKFDTAFGLNLAEHVSFVRRSLGFDSNAQDTGVEVGMVNEDKNYFAHMSLTNGSLATATTTDLFDTNDSKAVLFKLGKWFPRRGFWGASGYYSKNSLNSILRYGGYGGYTCEKFQFLAELDFGTDKILPTDTRTNLWALYTELTHRYSKRLHVTGSFEFFDPDKNISRNEMTRLSIMPRWSFNTFSTLSFTVQKNFETPEGANDKFFLIYSLWY